jgi:cytochrome c biogenesis protein CcdA
MKNKNLFMYILGALIVLGFFGLLALLIYKGIPEQNNDVLNITIGGLLAAFATIVSYFYGSSKGSHDKNEMLNK